MRLQHHEVIRLKGRLRYLLSEQSKAKKKVDMLSNELHVLLTDDTVPSLDEPRVRSSLAMANNEYSAIKKESKQVFDRLMNAWSEDS